MRTLLITFLLCWYTGLFAQPGNYFLSHYSPSEEHFDNVCFDMVQDNRGLMYFATQAGVLQFDGLDWDALQSQSGVYALKIAPSGEIFWAGAKGFGKINYSEDGFQQLQLLSDSTAKNVVQIITVDNQLYFLSDHSIYLFDVSTGKINTIKSSDLTGGFTKLFELYGVVYVNTERDGIFKVEPVKLIRSNLTITGDIIFFSRIKDQYVVATSENKIYTCSQSLEFTPVHIHDQAYADASVIVSGSWVNPQLVALGTLRGGVMFINPINGRTEEIVNYSTGLPDNEVFALVPDQNQNIWVAHDYGFTKISPYMPFRSFSHYPGLQGNLLCAYSMKNQVYAGTSLGLFMLQREDIYEELVYYVDVEIPGRKKSSRKKQQESKTEEKPEPKSETESKRGGFFSFLKKKNKKATVTDAKKPEVAREEVPEPEEDEETQTKREQRVKKVLRASQYVFKKIEGVDAKVTHLVEISGKLLASGLGGIYEISGSHAKAVLEEPVRFIYASQHRNILFASTYEDEVRSLSFNGKSWKQNNLLDKLDDQINYIFEGNQKELWLCGLDDIYRLEVTDAEIRLIQTLELINPNFEKTVGVAHNDTVMFANADGFFHFDRKTQQIVRLDSLGKPTHFFADESSILYNDQHGWNVAGTGHSQSSLQLLNLFQDLRFISSDKSTDNLWIITGSNELYKFYNENLRVYNANLFKSAFPVFLKSVVNDDKQISALKPIRINEEHSAVIFQIVQPDYVSPQAVEFQYFIEGLDRDTSEWSTTYNKIAVAYLPPGDYTLHVKSRNIFGKVTTLKPTVFEVKPPYWKRSWFYALEFALFASLVLLSFRLSIRYRIISRVLSLLTIILLIQFIQTVIGATIITSKTSPVIDFFIQVIVALLVLPVEGYLRNLMLRSLDPTGKIYQLIGPKAGTKVLEKEELKE